ncbi:MAG: glycosyl hydrolase family 8, partial [Candidatus Binatia bacterium]
IWIAWALARGGTEWSEPAFTASAREIAGDIRRKLLRRRGDQVLLLPAEHGFETPRGLVLNLSYWVFPAFDELAAIDPHPVWSRLSETGLALLHSVGFGRWKLPPDWLTLEEAPVVSKQFAPVFGYNAVRIPLHLVWAGKASPANLKPYRDFWGYFDGARFTPARTNLEDDCVDSFDAPAGIRAIVELVRSASQESPSASSLARLEDGEDYYSASLLLLTKLAIAERSSS